MSEGNQTCDLYMKTVRPTKNTKSLFPWKRAAQVRFEHAHTATEQDVCNNDD